MTVKRGLGVYLQRDPKTKQIIRNPQNPKGLDDTKTNQKDVDVDLKTPYRNFAYPKSKVPPVPT